MNDYTIFRKPRYCKNLQTTLGHSKYAVEVGDLILFREYYTDGTHGQRLGRVLGLANRPMHRASDPGSTTLFVLATDDMLTHAYERHVELDDVLEIQSPSNSRFAEWFLRGKVPLPSEALQVVRFGAMNNRYIDRYLETGTDGRPKLAFKTVRLKELRGDDFSGVPEVSGTDG